MDRLHRKAALAFKALMLISGGVGAGVLASSITTSTVKWQRPSRIPMVEQVVSDPVDQGSAGRAWARTAFDGGLRRCPEMNAEFLAACQLEMKLLLERPKLAYGSYGGPLLITKYEPVPDIEPYRSAEPDKLPLEEPVDPVPVVEVAEQPTPVNYPAAEAAAEVPAQ
ncbi:hypothetical protein [Sphingomonas sp.]|jgi:hypothetical protein|uniref:hypothetical protein n=1 Tax=Sphingomonas sp. TaxID=28214 RepID=UPI002DE65F54|nr:hypothetical protein [Sphingomonas sp.]